MKVIIAGSNGIIGSFLYSQLNKDFSLLSLEDINSQNQNIIERLDLTNMVDVDNFVKNCEYFQALIFLVGLAHSKGESKTFSKFKEINYKTLTNLLSTLQKYYKVPDKIIFASTISVYGEKYKLNQYFEKTFKDPYSPYAITKLYAENYLRDKYNEKSWILRLAPVYSDNFNLNIKRRTKIRNCFYRVGRGNNKLSLCNIKNIEIVIRSILTNQIPIGCYNISDVKEYSYNDLLDYQNAKYILPIPKIIIKILYLIGLASRNIFLKENTIKLLTNNIYPSDKIRKYVSLDNIIKNFNEKSSS